jgi:hypothetical protein
MKLPDFTEANELNQLREKVGANLVEINLNHIWIPADPKEAIFVQRGELEGVGISDITMGSGKPFELYGRKVLVYIRDQYKRFRDHENNNYKFHLTNCSTIQSFQKEKRYEGRYVASMNTSGLFDVNIIDSFGSIIGVKKGEPLTVCRNCLASLDYKSYSMKSFNGKTELYASFNLDEYFKIYKSTTTSPTRHTSESSPLNKYPEDWDKISRDMKKRYNYKCQDNDCPNKGYSFISRPKELHVHHINSNKGDVSASNLIILCEYCHQKKHSHTILKSL